MVAYPPRYRATPEKINELMDLEEYGELFLLDAMMDGNLRGCADPCGLNKTNTLDGGVFSSALPYTLDVLLWIGG